MTTIETLSEYQIATLHAEAMAHGDIEMAVVCEVASAGPEFIGHAHYNRLSPDVQTGLQGMTRETARALVVRAINDAEAQSDPA